MGVVSGFMHEKCRVRLQNWISSHSARPYALLVPVGYDYVFAKYFLVAVWSKIMQFLRQEDVSMPYHVMVSALWNSLHLRRSKELIALFSFVVTKNLKDSLLFSVHAMQFECLRHVSNSLYSNPCGSHFRTCRFVLVS